MRELKSMKQTCPMMSLRVEKKKTSRISKIFISDSRTESRRVRRRIKKLGVVG